MKLKSWIAVAVVLCLALAAPYLSAGPLKQRLQRALELALSRPVRIQGETHFRILPTPALLADDVIIGEDPNFSLEPFAYVTVLEVQPSILGLIAGRLEASRIRLTEPSVNLMRGPRGWNVQSLAGGVLRPPELEVRNGRLNFKQGDAKSAFYLTNALVDISAPTAQGDVKIFVSAAPARTDRGAQGFGTFDLRGEVHASAGTEPELDFDVELQPSSIHAFNFFFGARSVDFAGKLSGKGKLKGPWTKARLEVGLQFEGLEPQSFLPFIGKSNRLVLAGSLDLPGQRLSLDTVGGEAVRVRMRARDFFQKPKGGLLLELRNVELSKLLDLGRQAGAKLTEGVHGKGSFHGVIGYSWPSKEEVPAQGMISFDNARLELPDQPSLEAPQALAIVDGTRWILSSTEIRVGESQSAAVMAEWNARNGALKVGIATQLLSVRGLKTGLGLMLRASNLPILSSAQSGSWQGNLRYERAEDSDPGAWSGRLSVSNSAVDLEGLPGPVEISTASIQFDPSRVAIRRMRAEWNSIELEGEGAYYPQSSRAAEINLTLSEASAADLVRILKSAQRPPSGLLEKMRFRRATMPDWLRSRNVSARVRIKSLQFASGVFQPLNLTCRWKGTNLEATIDASEFSIPNQPASAGVAGKFSSELWQPVADYRFTGIISNWPLEKGTASFSGTLNAGSLEEDWLDSLEGEGTVAFTEAPQEEARLHIKQGKFVLESSESKRKTVTPPYWSAILPSEP